MSLQAFVVVPLKIVISKKEQSKRESNDLSGDIFIIIHFIVSFGLVTLLFI